MRILTIETATPLETVAVVDGGNVLAERTTRAGRGRADELTAAVADVLSDTGIGLPDLSALAVSIGPGRFTGLRVGLATAKGLAASTGLPIIPVPTLEALAASASAPAGTLVCPMLDARRGEVYAALFRAGPELERLIPDGAVDPAALAESVRGLEGEDPVVLVGTGAALYREQVEGALGGRATFPADSVERPSPLAIAEIAGRLEPADAASLSPVYLRGV